MRPVVSPLLAVADVAHPGELPSQRIRPAFEVRAAAAVVRGNLVEVAFDLAQLGTDRGDVAHAVAPSVVGVVRSVIVADQQ